MVRVRRLTTEQQVSLQELSRLSGLPVSRLLELIEAGVLEPGGSSPETWRFSHRAIYRARVSMRLQRDLGVNLAGIGLALDLLEEVHRLRLRAARDDDDAPGAS